MVTQNETDASSEIDSSPDATESLSSGDRPLILSEDFEDDRWGSEDEATESTVESGDETPSDDSESQPEETSEDTEAPVAEVTEETPEESTETEKEAEAEKVRQYSQDEWSKRESAYRTQQSEAQKQLETLQTQMSELQRAQQDQVLDAEVRGYAQSLKQQLEAEGHDEAAAERLATQQANAAKAAYQAQVQANSAQSELQQLKQARERDNTIASVDRLMREHNVPEEHRDLLLGYSKPELAVKAAQTLGEAEKLKTESKVARQAEVPSGGEANQYDGGSGATGAISDDQWLARYSSGDLADTTANDERAMKILTERGMAPTF